MMPAALHEPTGRTALVVMRVNGQMMLCPFFGKCDGVMVVDANMGDPQYLPLERHTPDAMDQLIVATGAHRLILGFVRDATATRFRALGIDVRLGSCACPVDELVAGFEDLPSA